MARTRDTLRDHNYWDAQVAFLDSLGRKLEAERGDPAIVYPFMLLYEIYKNRLQLLIARYSRGDDIAVLQQTFPQVIEAFLAYSHAPGSKPLDLDDWSDYVWVLWLLSLALLLRTDVQLVRELVHHLGVTGQDALVDYLIVAHGLLNGHPSDYVLHPRPYEFLVQALHAQGIDQQRWIERFLKTYYRGMRHTYWFDLHLLPDAGYFGYWCFELAACVRIAQIDDHRFADNVYYPRDLVTWSQGCPTSSP